jgi:hypothetical protein
MANENSLRSYRDYDAYDRDAQYRDVQDREPGAMSRHDSDPLADLARIMGQDDTYADLLKSIARTRTEPVFAEPAAAEEAEEAPAVDGEYDVPAMPLRGAVDDGIDWEDLEAELAKHREAAAEGAADESIDELRGSHEIWHGEAAAHDELDRRLHAELGQAYAEGGEGGRMPNGAYLAAGAAAAVAVGAGAYAMGRGRDGTGHAAAPRDGGQGYAPDTYAASAASEPYAADGDEFQEPPRRRRAGLTTVAAVLGLAVLGGGGVYAYRSMSGGGSAGGEARIIRADQAPVRVAAQQGQDPKPVTDRVAPGERVVVREERPVSPREQAAQVQEPPAPRVIPLAPAPAAPPAPAPAAPAPVAAAAPAPRVEEPRRVRTVQVGPDGSIMTPSPAPAAPPVRPAEPALSVVPVSNPPAAAARLAAADSRPVGAPAVTGTPMPPPRPVQTIRVARAEPAASPTSVEPVRPAPSSAAASRPIDLAPQQTASVRPSAAAPSSAPAVVAGSGGTFVQISSHQSEAEARSAFAAAQRRYALLQGQSLNIRSAEIPGRGTWHRVRVGPFSRAEAQSFCERLRGAGGSCVLN